MMRPLLPLIPFVVVALGCGDSESDTKKPGGTPTPDAGCWWCEDGSVGGASGAGGSGTGGKGGATSKDAGKGGSGGKGDYAVWFGSIDTATAKGTYTYGQSVAGTACEIVYDVENLTDVALCSDCEFAKSFTLGAVVSSQDEASCSVAVGKTGAKFTYAHGKLPSSTGKSQQLLEDQQGKWVEVGTSDNAIGKSWVFFVTPSK